MCIRDSAIFHQVGRVGHSLASCVNSCLGRLLDGIGGVIRFDHGLDRLDRFDKGDIAGGQFRRFFGQMCIRDRPNFTPRPGASPPNAAIATLSRSCWAIFIYPSTSAR